MSTVPPYELLETVSLSVPSPSFTTLVTVPYEANVFASVSVASAATVYVRTPLSNTGAPNAAAVPAIASKTISFFICSPFRPTPPTRHTDLRCLQLYVWIIYQISPCPASRSRASCKPAS